MGEIPEEWLDIRNVMEKRYHPQIYSFSICTTLEHELLFVTSTIVIQVPVISKQTTPGKILRWTHMRTMKQEVHEGITDGVNK